MRHWGVMISGNGSNLQALLDHPDIHVSVVISSNVNAYGLVRARRAGIPVEVSKNEDEILQILNRYHVKNLFLAGFMKILSQDFIKRFNGQILNIHPSLLPKYKGLNAFKQAIDAGDEEFGVTVHHVTPEVDSGEYIVQRKFKTAHQLWLHINEQLALKHMKWTGFK
jgi:phosphoribosylglycinamide formyltransferase-1